MLRGESVYEVVDLGKFQTTVMKMIVEMGLARDSRGARACLARRWSTVRAPFEGPDNGKSRSETNCLR
jgi:hypothetical protein